MFLQSFSFLYQAVWMKFGLQAIFQQKNYVLTFTFKVKVKYPPLLSSSHHQQYMYKVSDFYIKQFRRSLVYKLFSCTKLSPEFGLQSIFMHKTKSWPWSSRLMPNITPLLTTSHPQQYFYKVSAFYIIPSACKKAFAILIQYLDSRFLRSYKLQKVWYNIEVRFVNSYKLWSLAFLCGNTYVRHNRIECPLYWMFLQTISFLHLTV